MNLEQALAILDACASTHTGTRQEHIVWQEALKVIRQYIDIKETPVKEPVPAQ